MQPEKGNILYISYDGMTDPLGQSQVIPYLEGLAKEGYRFTLLSFEKADKYAQRSSEISTRLNESNIAWVPLSYTKSPPVLSTLWDIGRMKRKAVALHREKKFEIVHCRSYISSIVGLRLKQEYGIKFLFDMRGFYADERVDGGLWNLDNPLYKAIYHYFKRKEKEFLVKADYSVCLTHSGSDIMHSWKEIPGQPVPIEVIPCCANLDLFSPEKVNHRLLAELRQKFGLQADQFVLSYLGSVGTWYLPDEMMDFFHCLLKHKPEARFLFITPDPAEEIIKEAVSRNIPAEHIIVTYAPHLEVPTCLALSDASIFFIKPLFSKKASSPTKQAEIMGMGLPQVCNSGVGDVDEITDEKCGVLVRNFTEGDYEAAVKLLLSSRFDPVYIRQRADEIYSLTHGVERFSKIYKIIMAAQ